MEKKTLLCYAFLTGCIIVISITLPYLISAVTGHLASRMAGRTQETEVITETETELDGVYAVGDPSQYAGDHLDPDGNVMSPEEQKQYEKYQEMVDDYQTYLQAFTHETVKADSLEKGAMEKFIGYSAEQFYEAAATYAYAKWGTGRTIHTIRFDSIREYQDDNGDQVVQAMVEFLHTSHPEIENAIQVVCIYYVNQGYYYFP